MKKEVKNKNGRVITDYNKIDMTDEEYRKYVFKNLFWWSIQLNENEPFPVVYGSAGGFIRYDTEDFSHIRFTENNKEVIDSIIKEFKMLESERQYLIKLVRCISAHEALSECNDSNSDFGKFLKKYNFNAFVTNYDLIQV